MTLRQVAATTILVASASIAQAESSPPASSPAPAALPVLSRKSAIPEKFDAACREAITPTTAQRLFDVLNKPLIGGDCHFDGVLTQTNVLSATWVANGKKLPPVRVAAAGCIGASNAPKDALVASIPPEVAGACPGVKPLIDTFLLSLSHEHAIAVSPVPRRRIGNTFFNIAYGLLVIAALIVAFWQYFRKKPASG